MRRTIRCLLLGALVLALGSTVRGDLASELGTLFFPITVVGPGTASFDETTGNLQVSGVAFRTHFSNSVFRAHQAPEGSLQIRTRVLDSSGSTAEGAGTPAFEMRGSMDVDGNGTIDSGETGVILTGDFVELTHQNAPVSSTAADSLGFRFRATGGYLAPLYAGKNIGVKVELANDGGWPDAASGQQFAASFSAAFRGLAEVKPIYCGTQIGDFVWYDVDADGVREPGEPGLMGVAVALKDASGNVVATTVTGRGPFNQGGYYLFERLPGLCAGTYTVEIDPATVPAGFFPTLPGATVPADDSSTSPVTVVLANDASTDHTLDFGFTTVFEGSITGTVWHDANANGLFESSEPYLNGVRIEVLDAATGAAVATQTTLAFGQYEFQGLAPGTYRVQVVESTVPHGFEPTIALAGPPESDSNGSPTEVVLSALNTRARHTDFGYVAGCTGEIGDFVWHDRNHDGAQNAGEPGLDGIRVSVLAANGTTVATTTTGPNGAYKFTGMCAGTYRVVIAAGDVPQGFSPATPDNKVVGPTLDSSSSPVTVVLATDTSIDSSVDLGFVAACTGSIGDRVWLDDDADGIQDASEPNLAGVTVNIRRRGDGTIIQTEITDAKGQYRFAGLCPGAYVIEVVPPAGLELSPAFKTDPALDSNPNSWKVDLLYDDSSDPTIDFGFFAPCKARIGSRVWNDVNGNGLQDAGEPGIGGVVVELSNPGTGVTWTQTTNAAGEYSFNSLCAGEYRVKVIPPAGFARPSPVGVGSDVSVDSNPDPSYILLPASTTVDESVDFGFTNYVAPTPTKGLVLTKTANKHTVVFGESVTFTYVVTNTGTTPLSNVKVVDDNATPTYAADDFVAGTVATLAPGASKQFTRTLVPPVKMCNVDYQGKTRHCGLMVVLKLLAHTKFVYLQAKDHRDDHRSYDGWWGGRTYSRKAKFRVSNFDESASTEVEGLETAGDNDSYLNGFSVTVDSASVTGSDGSVRLPRVSHKFGWDSDWRDDWDLRFGNFFRLFDKWWDDDRWGWDNDHDYDWLRRPKQCATTSTNIAVATATAADGESLSVKDKETVEVVAPVATVPYKTFTQGGWGAKPSGNNPGKFLKDSFSKVYPSTGLIIGGAKTIKLTSAGAVEAFLPQGGTPGKLTASYVNPTKQITVLAGQVLALKLNVDFSAKGLTRKGLGSLLIVSGELKGRTVAEVLTLANAVLGGGSLPSGLTLSELNSILSSINENFDGGTHDNGYLKE